MKLCDEQKAEDGLYLYSSDEIMEYEKYVKKTFGKFPKVFHEIVSPDIHLDIVIVPPISENDCYKLITMGAGAYNMDVPEDLSKWNLDCAEYIIYLPSDWNIASSKPEDYWPIGMMKQIARLPIYGKTWLTAGHTVYLGEQPVTDKSAAPFTSVMLLNALDRSGRPCKMELSSGRVVNFYLIYPLYKEELDYKLDTCLNDLLECFPEEDFSVVIDPCRPNYCKSHGNA